MVTAEGRQVEYVQVKTWQVPTHAGPLLNAKAVIFPEGRTTDGKTVRRFQPRLFQAAIDANAKVQPVALRYVRKDGARTSRISYEGDIGFLESVWKTLAGPGFVAELYVYEPLESNRNRDELSKLCYEKVSKWVEIT